MQCTCPKIRWFVHSNAEDISSQRRSLRDSSPRGRLQDGSGRCDSRYHRLKGENVFFPLVSINMDKGPAIDCEGWNRSNRFVKNSTGLSISGKNSAWRRLGGTTNDRHKKSFKNFAAAVRRVKSIRTNNRILLGSSGTILTDKGGLTGVRSQW
jgi:hypothetical protein